MEIDSKIQKALTKHGITNKELESELESIMRAEIYRAEARARIGLQKPTGDTMADFFRDSAVLSEKTLAPAAVMERLCKLNMNWPKYGENLDFDRVCRNIVKAEAEGRGNVEAFIEWTRAQKDAASAIGWYGKKPDNIWLDWGICFPILTQRSTSKKYVEDDSEFVIAPRLQNDKTNRTNPSTD